ncbi:unnamed protein product [Urochloa humidicola]
MVRLSSARFIVEKNSVTVLSPRSLRGHHEAAIANYGVPEYGGTLTGVTPSWPLAASPSATTTRSSSGPLRAGPWSS